MSDNYNSIIDQDWDELALDDGTIVDEFGTYSATIYPRDGTGADTLESQVEGISYSPEVNAAKSISVDVEPLSALEGTDYLGGIVDVFVNNQPIFSGKIYTIDTSFEEGTFYTLEAEPPAKELRNETINETTDNYLLSDYCAKTIDRFNDFDGEHFNHIDTADESLIDINKLGRGREATSNSATATYSNVGSDASNIDILYVKLLVDGSVDVTIDTVNFSYSETFTSSSGTYGDWFKIEPSGLDAEQYDIQYSLETGSVLYDWISITSSEITRTLEPGVVETARINETVQEASTNAEWQDIVNISSTDPYKIENNKLVPLQTAFVFEGEDSKAPFIAEDSNTEYSEGFAHGFQIPSWGDKLEYIFTPEYDIENYDIYIRENLVDDGDGDVIVPNITLNVNGSQTGLTIDGSSFLPTNGPSWRKIWFNDNNFSTLTSGQFTRVTFEVQAANLSDYDEWWFDVVAIVDSRYYNDGQNNFDNIVNQDDGYLDEPYEYPQDSPAIIDFNEINVGEDVETAYLNVNAVNSSGVDTLGVSFDSGTTFKKGNNTESIAKNNGTLTSSVIGRIGTRGWEENGARNQTPRLGYTAREIDLYELQVDTNDIEILFDSDPSGNRLKVLTDIIDNSRLYYRVEGSDIRLFRRGDKKTNIDLRKENVTSSVSIDGVYSSCEVIGDGVTSGVIGASDPVPYVDRHKEIRDPNIKNKDDATRRARSFLEEHSGIEYQGNISTLPTLAPLGEKINGSIFSHGKDSFIESVRYGKRRTTIDVGRTKELQTELLDLDRGVDSSRTRGTS